MRFLCVSDQIDPLIYSTSLRERYDDVDAVFCAGDLPMDYVDFIVSSLGKPTYFVFGNHDLTEFDYYKRGGRVEPTAGAPFGDPTLSHSHGGDYVSNKSLRVKKLSFKLPDGQETPLLIAGVSGSMRYNNGKDQYTEGEMMRQLLFLMPKLVWNKLRYGRYCDVFLTHASPRHIHDKEDDCHKGFECFNWFIRKFKPALLLHGHIHLYDLATPRTTVSDMTTVVNVYSHIVIDFNPIFSDKGNYANSNITILSDR
ncbi:MAG: metallophosphoesterase [Treponema sp.]|nr:metallophosphoesterase [Treponema sp.]